ncbi:hypothetical protein SDC9_49844 [bioreactor metagenome]|jgi:RNA polymerase sigma factor (sigma-70 family)|uniref:RNA polymerase sigma-70 region 2 domain-containing protein n=1 Tax=bioreactor metagenome TaxID=1076179 RepID=A0A644WJ27_9ZZZZ
MEDNEIIEFYWRRSEQAIQESGSKYGSYCLSIANNILSNLQDSEECVNSTWLNAWNAIPPQRPNHLSAFFAKITRNLSINKLKARTAEKRSGNEATVVIDELGECLSASDNVEAEYQGKELGEKISQFLRTLSERECNMFIRRYFYVQPVGEIAKHYRLKESNVLVILSRTRKKLRFYLQKEGYMA